MNYLAHLYLAPDDDESLLGNLMGDFVKGPLDGRFSPGIAAGIRLHRHIDSFAQQDPAFRRSKKRLSQELGYFRGILVDIYYDHFLARDWDRYATQPLETFAERIYALLRRNEATLPEGLQDVAPRMIAHNWLLSYRHRETVRTVLERISLRLQRPNPLPAGYEELLQHDEALTRDFAEFLPRARLSAERFRSL